MKKYKWSSLFKPGINFPMFPVIPGPSSCLDGEGTDGLNLGAPDNGKGDSLLSLDEEATEDLKQEVPDVANGEQNLNTKTSHPYAIPGRPDDGKSNVPGTPISETLEHLEIEGPPLEEVLKIEGPPLEEVLAGYHKSLENRRARFFQRKAELQEKRDWLAERSRGVQDRRIRRSEGHTVAVEDSRKFKMRKEEQSNPSNVSQDFALHCNKATGHPERRKQGQIPSSGTKVQSSLLVPRLESRPRGIKPQSGWMVPRQENHNRDNDPKKLYLRQSKSLPLLAIPENRNFEPNSMNNVSESMAGPENAESQDQPETRVSLSRQRTPSIVVIEYDLDNQLTVAGGHGHPHLE